MEGREQYFEQFYRAHFDEVVVHAYRFLGNWDDAALAAQDAFQVCWEKFDVFLACPNQIGWIKNTVKNKARELRREREKMAQLLISWDELPADLPAQDCYGAVAAWDAVACVLSSEELSLLKRVAIDGLSYQEAADEFGLTVWACRKRIQRAREKLRKHQKEEI